MKPKLEPSDYSYDPPPPVEEIMVEIDGRWYVPAEFALYLEKQEWQMFEACKKLFERKQKAELELFMLTGGPEDVKLLEKCRRKPQ